MNARIALAATALLVSLAALGADAPPPMSPVQQAMMDKLNRRHARRT